MLHIYFSNHQANHCIHLTFVFAFQLLLNTGSYGLLTLKYFVLVLMRDTFVVYLRYINKFLKNYFD